MFENDALSRRRTWKAVQDTARLCKEGEVIFSEFAGSVVQLVRTSACHGRRSRVRVRRSRHFRIANLSCQRCSLEILCSCRPQRQVAIADSSLKPSRVVVTDRTSRSGSLPYWEPSRVVSQIEMPSATTSVGSASTRHKPGVFPPAIVSIRRFGYKHLLRSVGRASSIHTGARSALTCCFPKGSVPSFLLETKMAVHR